MKVLSLLQPWASLVVEGHKKIETRSWNTKYRGELLIHASVGKKGKNFAETNPHAWVEIHEFDYLPFGAIIGKVDLIGTFSTDALLHSEVSINHKELGIITPLSNKEIAFGDYSPNRYGWILANPVIFKELIQAKGQLGIWNWNFNGDIDYRVNKCHPSLEDIINAKNIAFISSNSK